MDGYLEPSKYKTYRRNKMSDGKDLNGFTSPKVSDASPWTTESYTEAPAAAVAAKDVSSQDGAGLGNNGK